MLAVFRTDDAQLPAVTASWHGWNVHGAGGLERHPSFWRMIQRIAWTAAGLHAGFMVIFALLGVTELVLTNVGSVLIFVVAGLLLRRHRLLLAYLLGMTEVIGHALLTVLTIGWGSGFHYYVLLLLPMLFLNDTLTMRTKWLLTFGLIGCYSLMRLLSQLVAPIYAPPPEVLETMQQLNIIAMMLLLAQFCYIYYRVVAHAERYLRSIAHTDSLTGLDNRRRWLERAAQVLQQRRAGEVAVSLIMGDIDHFKQINDRCGHDGGDAALVRVSRLLSTSLRRSDCVARWGGEEFIMLLPATPLAQALHVAEALRLRIEQTCVDTANARLSMTFGVCELGPGESIEAAISRADAALYSGKRNGRNRVEAAEAVAGT